MLFCSLTGAAVELLCEVIFSPFGYRISQQWEEEQVGEQYIRYREDQERAVS